MKTQPFFVFLRQLKKIRKFKSGVDCKRIVSVFSADQFMQAHGDLIFSDFFSLGSVWAPPFAETKGGNARKPQAFLWAII
jgi:hypothetical protein